MFAVFLTSVKGVLEQYRHADPDCFFAHIYGDITLNHSHDAANAFVKRFLRACVKIKCLEILLVSLLIVLHKYS
jgi:hypothetical protein